MSQNRREFLGKSILGLGALLLSPYAHSLSKSKLVNSEINQSKPWIELSKQAYLHNAIQIQKMANNKPIIAVLKNNAYGLGDTEVAKILDQSPQINCIAIVKDSRALELKKKGVSKPVLLMGDFDSSIAQELVEEGVILNVFSEESADRINDLSKKVNQKILVALYIDTGLGRMGIPYQKTLQIAQIIQKNKNIEIVQTFSTLTTPDDFAKEQIKRFDDTIQQLKKEAISCGTQHLAPSLSLLSLKDSFKDAVRPGILLHGSFPLVGMPQQKKFTLKPTFKLKAPIMRLEKLKAGETIGFSRFYKIEKDEWIATLPIGWADGYYSGAENGAKVMINKKLYPVVNVNASHTNISLGSSTNLKIGEIATLIGPDHEDITPVGFAKLTKGHNYLQINFKESLEKRVYESF